jgi:hypothetical protein
MLFYEDRSQQNHRPQIAELARKTCEPLAQQSEFLPKEWRNLSHEQISEYTVRHDADRESNSSNKPRRRWELNRSSRSADELDSFSKLVFKRLKQHGIRSSAKSLEHAATFN